MKFSTNLGVSLLLLSNNSVLATKLDATTITNNNSESIASNSSGYEQYLNFDSSPDTGLSHDLATAYQLSEQENVNSEGNL